MKQITKLVIYNRQFYWIFALSFLAFMAAMLFEINVHMNEWNFFSKSLWSFDWKQAFSVLPGLSGVWVDLFLMFICVYNFFKPMMVLESENLKTRSFIDPFFRVRLWDTIYKVEVRNNEDPHQAALRIFSNQYEYREYKMPPGDLKRVVEFISARLSKEKLILA